MFFLGALGIVQVLFLPGLIFTSIIDFPKRFLERLFISIAASMVINYCLVLLLTVCHIYVRPVVIVLLLAEAGMLIWLNRRALNTPIEASFLLIKKAFNDFVERWRNYFNNASEGSALEAVLKFLYILICLLLAGVALRWILKLFSWNLGSVFNSYDTVAVWNHWALSWAENRLPSSTYRYPQLLPANWSLMYLIMGNSDLQFFAKSYMPLFTFFILVMMVDLGFRKKNAGYFLGVVVAYLALKKFLSIFLIEGLADMPTAFFAFTALYFLILHHDDPRDDAYIKNAAMGVLAGAGAGGTKQVGLVFFALYCVLCLLFIVRPLFHDDRKRTIRLIWVVLAIVMIVVIPLVYPPINRFRSGLAWMNLKWAWSWELQIIHFVRMTFLYVSAKSARRWGKYFYIFMLVIPFAFVIDSLTRAISLLIALPLFVFWGVFASYDFRNLAVAITVFSMCVGLNMQWLVDKGYSLIRKIRFEKIRWGIVLSALLILLLLVGRFIYTDDLLMEKQTEKVVKTFSESINRKLLDALADETGDYQILTNYPLDYLPGLDGHKHSSVFTDYQSYLEDINNRNIDFLLVPNYADQQILDDIQQRIDAGEFQLIFSDDTWIPCQFVRILTTNEH